MTLLFFFKARGSSGGPTSIPDVADVLRRKRKILEKQEEEIAAQLINAMLAGEDVIIPEKTINLRHALEEKLISALDDSTKIKVRQLMLLMAMEG